MILENTKEFFAFIKERQDIYLRRFVEKSPAPWTEDPILQNYRFTNVYRELDATTIWFRENVRDPLKDDLENILFATILFRWFNKSETGAAILGEDNISDSLFCVKNFSKKAVEERVRPLSRWITGSYIIKTPNEVDKLEGVLQCVNNTVRHIPKLTESILNKNTLQHANNLLSNLPFLGGFMAYELTTDLRHTKLLSGATDIMTWANPGPGAMRGANRILKLPVDRKLRTDFYIKEMKELLELSKDTQNWPNEGHFPPLEMRDIEHSLCEFDKYLRAKNGQGRPKQIFRGGTGEVVAVKGRPKGAGGTSDPFLASLQEFRED